MNFSSLQAFAEIGITWLVMSHFNLNMLPDVVLLELFRFLSLRELRILQLVTDRLDALIQFGYLRWREGRKNFLRRELPYFIQAASDELRNCSFSMEQLTWNAFCDGAVMSLLDLEFYMTRASWYRVLPADAPIRSSMIAAMMTSIEWGAERTFVRHGRQDCNQAVLRVIYNDTRTKV